MLLQALVVTGLTVAGWLTLVRHFEKTGGEISICRVTYVYDGDTVAVSCGGAEVTVRLVGLDTPETKEPRCEAELAAGKRATERLRALVDAGEVALRRVGVDKYDRPLVVLTVDGADVADTLVGEGLAVTYSGGTRIDWCGRLEAG